MFSLDQIIDKATEIGFDAVAITDPSPLKESLQELEKCKAEGRYPEFAEQDLILRTTPKKLMHEVKTIISLAIAYKTVDPENPVGFSGSLARYSWGKDYHVVFKERLEQFTSFLRENCGVNKVYSASDITPLAERALAMRAGLGNQGANCCLYVKSYGSWVVLGEILIDVKLPETAIKPSTRCDDCDDCGMCVKACPTNALYEPFKIRPQLCLSYLTQMKGIIPTQLRKYFGRKLWGCDICQQVCPRNIKADRSRHQEFMPLYGTTIPLLPLLSLSNKEFQATFGETAIAWRGKSTLQRNACIILGNIGDPLAIDSLEIALNSPNESVRASSAWALGQIGGKKARLLLTKAYSKEQSLAVKEEITSSLEGSTP
ncbi:MAG: tRNA epoxyqueuosine(34) reductase QueG [Firmicutes bacterium]|nr:tRNA epoxyqueuosine(34) reductase QueG [Bacillota bacterium]